MFAIQLDLLKALDLVAALARSYKNGDTLGENNRTNNRNNALAPKTIAAAALKDQ